MRGAAFPRKAEDSITALPFCPDSRPNLSYNGPHYRGDPAEGCVPCRRRTAVVS